MATDQFFQYNNLNAAVAGQMVAKGAENTYQEFMLQLLKLAGISGPDGGAGKVSGRRAGEALYHAGIPRVGTDATFGTTQFLPGAYGWNPTPRMAAGGWVFTGPELARLMASVDTGPTPLLSADAVKKWLLDDVNNPAVPSLNLDGIVTGTIRPALGWDTYFSLQPPAAPYASDALTKNGGVSGAVAQVTRRLADATTMVVLFNGNFITGNAIENALVTSHAKALFSQLPVKLGTLNLFPLVNSSWS